MIANYAFAHLNSIFAQFGRLAGEFWESRGEVVVAKVATNSPFILIFARQSGAGGIWDMWLLQKMQPLT
jgi:hypothetical protein